MTRDLPEIIHRASYGRSDKVNAPENQSEEFQSGYKAGSALKGEPMDAIKEEWIRRGSPGELPVGFREWKRGLWAARMQRTFAALTPPQSEEKL